MRNDDRIVIIWVSIIVLLLFIAVGFMIGAKYSTNETTYFVCQNVMSIAYVILGLTVITPLCKKLSIVSILMVAGNGVLSIGQLHFLPYRTYHRLLIVILTLCILYLAFCLLRFFISRKQYGRGEKSRLLNGIIPIAYVVGSVLVKGFGLFKLIETEYDVPLVLVGISLGISVAAVILGASIIQDRRNRKEYAGKLCAIFFGVFFAVFAIPLLSMEYANYAFDTTMAEKKECIVVDTYTSHNYKSGTGYRFVLSVDGQKVHFDVDRVVYSRYQKGDTIYLYQYGGAFGYPYYEYRLDSIYCYDEE